MPLEKKEHLQRFVSDIEMAKAVHGFLLKVFLKPPANRDVQSLAAAWMAKDRLDDAWKELSGFRPEIVREEKALNTGL